MFYTLHGMINAFMSGDLINDNDSLRPAIYIRRVIHYLHTTLVINNHSQIGSRPTNIMDVVV